jgi:hypothetical protein
MKTFHGVETIQIRRNTSVAFQKQKTLIAATVRTCGGESNFTCLKAPREVTENLSEE